MSDNFISIRPGNTLVDVLQQLARILETTKKEKEKSERERVKTRVISTQLKNKCE